MAGEVADEIKIGRSATPAMMSAWRGCVLAGARAAGRGKLHLEAPDPLCGALMVIERGGRRILRHQDVSATPFEPEPSA